MGRQPDGAVSRRPGDPNAYQDPMGYRPSWMGPDERTYYPNYLYGSLENLPDARVAADAASYSASNRATLAGATAPRSGMPALRSFTPTRGKGSTRLRNVKKKAEEAPKSSVTDKPSGSSKGGVKKPSAKGKRNPKKVTSQETVTEAQTPSKELVRVERPRSNENTAPRQRDPIELTTRPVERPVPAKRPSKVSRPKTKRGRKTGGSSAQGGRVFTMGGTGKDVAVRQGSAVAVREAEKASGVSKGKKLAARLGGATAVGLAGGAVGLEFKKLTDAENAAEAAVVQTSADADTRTPRVKQVLRDKYGRKITREEYNRRETYRKKLEGMSPAERKAARKEEMTRREKWRKSIGKQLFKKQATKAYRNLDIKEKVTSRELNALMRKAKTRQEAIDIRKKFLRDKKD
jgi:hypothetical protein